MRERRGSMSEESTKRVIEAYLEDLRGQGPYKRHFSDDVAFAIVGTGPEATGPDAVEQTIEHFHREAFDARPEVRTLVVAKDRAVAELDFVGRHTGEFSGVAATGREVSVPYCAVYDLQGEKIKALRLYFPMDALLRQLGAVSSPMHSEEAGLP
jgi:predicted ester cyclase